MNAPSSDFARTAKAMHSSGDLAAAALVGLLTFVGLALLMRRDVGLFDEGIVLTDAMRVMAGQVIHRDFYSSYGPAQYYAVGAVLGLFDGSFLAARLYDVACKALTCGLLFYITTRVTGRALALLAAVAAGLWFLEFAGSPFYPVYPCMLLGLVATFLTALVSEGRGSVWAAVAAGVCCGATALFRYDVGFLLLVANLIGLGALLWLGDASGAAFRRLVVLGTAYALGTSLVFVPVAAAFLLVAPVGGFWHDIIDYSAKYYAPMRGLPFPHPWGRAAGGVYFTPLVAGLGLIESGRMFRCVRQPADGASVRVRSYLVLFSLCAALFFVKGLVRVSVLHTSLGNVPAFVVAAILAQQWLGGSRLAQAGAGLIILLLIGPPADYAASEVKLDIRNPQSVLLGYLAGRSGADRNAACRVTARSKVATYSPDYAQVANFIERRTRPDERILVALDHNDKVFVNAMSLYFASGRLPGTHWSQFDPGLQTRADTQAAIITDLQARRVRWVVRDGNIDNPHEPNGSAISSGVKLLDDYLDANYRPVAASGRVAVWLLKTESPPNPDGASLCEPPLIN